LIFFCIFFRIILIRSLSSHNQHLHGLIFYFLLQLGSLANNLNKGVVSFSNFSLYHATNNPDQARIKKTILTRRLNEIETQVVQFWNIRTSFKQSIGMVSRKWFQNFPGKTKAMHIYHIRSRPENHPDPHNTFQWTKLGGWVYTQLTWRLPIEN
jgi:hypothetical protein